MATFEKGDMLVCFDTGTEAAVVGTYKETRVRGGRVVGQCIAMHCSQREDAPKCRFYDECKRRLKFIENR